MGNRSVLTEFRVGNLCILVSQQGLSIRPLRRLETQILAVNVEGRCARWATSVKMVERQLAHPLGRAAWAGKTCASAIWFTIAGLISAFLMRAYSDQHIEHSGRRSDTLAVPPLNGHTLVVYRLE